LKHEFYAIQFEKSIIMALRCIPTILHIPPTITKALIYTDGSGAHGDNEAAWAIAILMHDGAQWAVLGWNAGLAPTDHPDPFYIGASSNTNGAAEVSAIAWAALAALSLFTNFPNLDTEIRYDSQTAAILANSQALSKKQPLLAAISSTLWGYAGYSHILYFTHVYAHKGEPWNCLADKAAEAASANPSARCINHPPYLVMGSPIAFQRQRPYPFPTTRPRQARVPS
jgi:ribonuclease HI